MVPQGDGEFYDHWRNVQEDFRDSNKADLLAQATKVGLHMISIDQDFAYMVIDSRLERDQKNTDHYQARFMGMGSGNRGPREIVARSKVNTELGPMLPWYLVSFVNPEGPVDLVNFVSPGKCSRDLKSLAKKELGLELGGSALPFTNWLIKGINGLVKYEDYYKEEKTTYLNRLQSYGAVLALTETHAYAPEEVEGLNFEQLLKAMQRFNFTLQPGKTQAEAWNEVSYALASEEERRGRLIEGPSIQALGREKEALFLHLRNQILRNGHPVEGEFRILRSPRSVSAAPLAIERLMKVAMKCPRESRLL